MNNIGNLRAPYLTKESSLHFLMLLQSNSRTNQMLSHRLKLLGTACSKESTNRPSFPHSAPNVKLNFIEIQCGSSSVFSLSSRNGTRSGTEAKSNIFPFWQQDCNQVRGGMEKAHLCTLKPVTMVENWLLTVQGSNWHQR